MPKAILELEMPESCAECPCKGTDVWGMVRCRLIHMKSDKYSGMAEGYAYKRRPDCPLKVNEQSNDVKQRLARGGAAFVVACDKTGIFKSATSLIREMFSAMEDTCVICGTYVPEGRMVCSVCEKDPFHVLRKEQDYEKG